MWIKHRIKLFTLIAGCGLFCSVISFSSPNVTAGINDLSDFDAYVSVGSCDEGDIVSVNYYVENNGPVAVTVVLGFSIRDSSSWEPYNPPLASIYWTIPGYSYAQKQVDAEIQFNIGGWHDICAAIWIDDTYTTIISSTNWQNYALYIYDDPEVEVYSKSIDDESGDGKVEPGESVGLVVTLKNEGTGVANNVYATISTSDSMITISDDRESFGNIARGDMATCSWDYDLEVDSNHLGGSVVFNICITDDTETWWDIIEIDVVVSDTQPLVEYNSYYVNNDQTVDAGETIELVVSLKNIGSGTAYGIYANLYVIDSLINIIDNYEEYGNIYSGSVKWCNENFKFEVSKSHASSDVTFYLVIYGSDGTYWEDSFDIFIKEAIIELPPLEPNNDYAEANEIIDGETQTHSIDPVGDIDYVKFTLSSISDVTLETSGISGDTTIVLYRPDGTTFIAQDTNGGSGAWSKLSYKRLGEGTYYAKIIENGNNEEISSYDVTLSVDDKSAIKGAIDSKEPISLMVFVSHPDDEAIACAGRIFETVQQGGNVIVVYLTLGDAFGDNTVKAVTQYEDNNPDDYFDRNGDNKFDMIDLGIIRSGEATIAMEKLGLDISNQIFLGYPDGNLTEMWNSESTISSYRTHHTSVPYELAYSYNESKQKGNLYNRVNLSREIKEILDKYNPQTILVPHPADSHRDHNSTAYFVGNVTAKLNMGNNVETYLVHYKYSDNEPYQSYPYKKSWLVQDSTNPQSVSTSVFISPEGIREPDSILNFQDIGYSQEMKLDVIESYTSQVQPDIAGYLISFAKQNEIFWDWTANLDPEYYFPATWRGGEDWNKFHVIAHIDDDLYQTIKEFLDNDDLTGALSRACTIVDRIDNTLHFYKQEYKIPDGEWYCNGLPSELQWMPCKERIKLEIITHIKARDPDVRFDKYLLYQGFWDNLANIIGNCPIELHLIDSSSGAHVGMNYTNDVIDQEIPGVIYTGLDIEPQKIYLPFINATYTLLIAGTDVGTYDLSVVSYVGENEYMDIHSMISKEEVHLYSVSTIWNGMDLEVKASRTYDIHKSVIDRIEISSESSSILDNQTLQYNAKILTKFNLSISHEVNWSCTGGSISTEGLYQPCLEGAWKIYANLSGKSENADVMVTRVQDMVQEKTENEDELCTSNTESTDGMYIEETSDNNEDIISDNYLPPNYIKFEPFAIIITLWILSGAIGFFVSVTYLSMRKS
ncbi:MAG: PIG-L family deacetylase [Candidatus Peribacteraceae bacterium]|nr:PIG-L family deacetylase [Candidatus Peribacteraceae bacterium]